MRVVRRSAAFCLMLLPAAFSFAQLPSSDCDLRKTGVEDCTTLTQSSQQAPIEAFPSTTFPGYGAMIGGAAQAAVCFGSRTS